ncbi:uncharacterized protein E0L32_012454, partial [Thyridium curvatum]
MSGSRSANNAPSFTMEQAGAEIQRLSALVQALQAGGTQSAKYEVPPMYGGSKESLRGFLTQCRGYLVKYKPNFPYLDDQVLFAATRLEGEALAWF